MLVWDDGMGLRDFGLSKIGDVVRHVDTARSIWRILSEAGWIWLIWVLS